MSSIQEDLDDLVGDPSPKPKRQRAAADNLDSLVRHNRLRNAQSGLLVEDLLRGVTVSFLAQVFDMDSKTVKQKLADCPPLFKRKAGYVYHFPTACRYLVKPALSHDQLVKTMKASDLPAAFQTMFWDAQLKRQKWEENAGQLWRTEKVRARLGDVFQTIKFTMQLWPDTIERQSGLTPKQHEIFVSLVDNLQQELYERLVTAMREKETSSQLGEIDDVINDKAEETDDYSHLV